MDKAYKYISIFLIIAVILLFAFAVNSELLDIRKLIKSKNICEISEPSEKEKLYIFYATLPYENAVTWRMIFIPAFISTIFLYFILNNLKIKVKMELTLIIFFVIFFVYYFLDGFKSYHFWRIAASKVQPKNIL